MQPHAIIEAIPGKGLTESMVKALEQHEHIDQAGTLLKADGTSHATGEW